jgi:hypothetical protein
VHPEPALLEESDEESLERQSERIMVLRRLIVLGEQAVSRVRFLHGQLPGANARAYGDAV